MNQPSADTTLHGLFRAQAARTPDAPAVAAPDGTLSYAGLDAGSDALAIALAARGVQAGDTVAISLPRSLAQMLAVLATLKAGAACLPLDTAYPPELRAYMLTDAHTRLVIDEAEMEKLMHAGSQLASPAPDTASAPEGLCYLIYTSGSTGRPKGVAMPHRAITNLCAWHRDALPLAAGARVLQFTTLSFDVAFQEIFTTWAEGGTLVLMTEELRRDPRALWKYLREQKIARLFLPYVALQQLAEHADLNSPPALVREIITAGEQLRITPQIRALFGALPGCSLHNHYGPSETHVVTAFTLPASIAEWPPLPSIGSAIAGVKLELFDEQQNPVAPGEVGELYAGGVCLADGYLGQPDLTAARFVEVRGVRFYRTGDHARALPDGNLEFLGRADAQIKIRGFRVEPGEIETRLAEHAAVRECAVIAHGQRLVAYWVGDAVPVAELREFMSSRVAPYLVPSAFVPLPAMPLTPSGKIDRRSLPEPAGVEHTPESRPPAGELEQAIGAVWREVLGLARVGVDDNFFDLGGTSLTIVTAQHLLNSHLRRDLAVTTLFQYPTIATLARHLSDDAAPSLRDRAQTRADLQRAAFARRRAPSS